MDFEGTKDSHTSTNDTKPNLLILRDSRRFLPLIAVAKKSNSEHCSDIAIWPCALIAGGHPLAGPFKINAQTNMRIKCADTERIQCWGLDKAGQDGVPRQRLAQEQAPTLRTHWQPLAAIDVHWRLIFLNYKKYTRVGAMTTPNLYLDIVNFKKSLVAMNGHWHCWHLRRRRALASL
jgi:hypothetical protein